LKQENGWYCGLATRFSNHYYVVIKKDDIKSRCGQINMRMLRGKSVSSLKLISSKTDFDEMTNRCASCKYLLEQDKVQRTEPQPFRY
jgi:hypothetical protein